MEDTDSIAPPSKRPRTSNPTISFTSDGGGNYGAQTGHNYGTINVRAVETIDVLKALQQTLYLTEPNHDLQTILRNKGTVIPGTCQWVLDHHEYCKWLDEEPPAMLRVIGGPGVGKTMLSSYLVQHIAKTLGGLHHSLFAHYFCDSKQNDRNTTTSVLRSIVLQLLRQKPELKSYLETDFELMGQGLCHSVDALWTFVKQVVTDSRVKVVCLLIDALDELTAPCRIEISALFRQLLTGPGNAAAALRLRLLVTHRQGVEFSPHLERFSTRVELNAQTTENDIGLFIESKVNDLTEMKKYPAKLSKDIREKLRQKANGTFLWASLLLDDLEHLQANDRVRSWLNRVPQNLNETFDRILANIFDDMTGRAARLLQFIIVARRPLTRSEIAIICFMSEAINGEQGTESPALSSFNEDDLAELIDCYTCCGALVFLDRTNDTINLVHQSVKDYLTSIYLKQHSNLNGYYSDTDRSNSAMLEILVIYMDMLQSVHGYNLVQRYFREYVFLSSGEDSEFEPKSNNDFAIDTKSPYGSLSRPNRTYPSICRLLKYAVNHRCDHASAAGREIQVQNILDHGMNQYQPILGQLLVAAARNGQADVVRYLLSSDAVPIIQIYEGQSAIHAAAENGHEEVIRLLLNDGRCDAMRDVEGRTALHTAVNFEWDNIVSQLGKHREGLMLEVKDFHGRSPLHVAVIRCGWRMESRAIVKLLMQLGSDPNTTSLDDQTPVSFALKYELYDVVELLETKTALTDQHDAKFRLQQVKSSRTSVRYRNVNQSKPNRSVEREAISAWQRLRLSLSMMFYISGREIFDFSMITISRTIRQVNINTDHGTVKHFHDTWRAGIDFHCQCVASRLKNQTEETNAVLLIREWTRFSEAISVSRILFEVLVSEITERLWQEEDLEQLTTIAIAIWDDIVISPMKGRLSKIKEDELKSWVKYGICEIHDAESLMARANGLPLDPDRTDS